MQLSHIGVFCAALSCYLAAADVKSRVLILSGANNHDWKQTTPAIRAALEETGRFEVDVEENVIAMKPDAFAPYAVVLSNFNTFGKDAPKTKEWPEETRKAFIDHMAKGHGLVIVHAGSSVFYDWREFHELACGTWKDGTSHGAIHTNRVTFNNPDSPITRGLEPFWIRDEFWQKTSVTPSAKALASVTPDPKFKGSGKPENILFSTEMGGGRGFAIMLGHDAASMKNSAWKTLLQRGTEWAATGKVTIPPSKNWPATKESAEGPALSWLRTDTSLALCNGDKPVWRLVYDATQPKTYFHPLATMDGEVLTAFEPTDHPWHRGLWWSWKFINDINYWEEDPKTGASDGVTQLVRTNVTPSDDFSARVELEFNYHPKEQKPILTEKRHLAIGKPDADGTYVIDWKSKFTAADQPVKLDRTVPEHLGGVSYGGYAGLSLRMAKGLENFSFRTSEGETTIIAHGKSARWVDLSNPTTGITILDHPGNPRHAPPWYLHSSQSMLFFSPAPLFNKPLELAPGESITLTYQVIIHSKTVTPARLEDQWRAFVQSQPTKP